MEWYVEIAVRFAGPVPVQTEGYSERVEKLEDLLSEYLGGEEFEPSMLGFAGRLEIYAYVEAGSPETAAELALRPFRESAEAAWGPGTTAEVLKILTSGERDRELEMPEHSFTLMVEGDVESRLDELFEAGCGDAAFGTVDGVHYADFDRGAPNFEEAVSSAVTDVERMGGLRAELIGWDGGAEMSRPNHCSNCGAALQGDNAAVGTYDDRSGDGGYDTYCQACGWSGDIMPDAEKGRFEEAGAARAQGRGTVIAPP